MLSWFRALLFITIFVLPHCKIFAGKKSAYTCVESRLIHHVEGVFFFPPLWIAVFDPYFICFPVQVHKDKYSL